MPEYLPNKRIFKYIVLHYAIIGTYSISIKTTDTILNSYVIFLIFQRIASIQRITIVFATEITAGQVGDKSSSI